MALKRPAKFMFGHVSGSDPERKRGICRTDSTFRGEDGGGRASPQHASTLHSQCIVEGALRLALAFTHKCLWQRRFSLTRNWHADCQQASQLMKVLRYPERHYLD